MTRSSPNQIFIRDLPAEILQAIRAAAHREGVIPRADGSATAAARWALSQFAKQQQGEHTETQETEAA